MTCTDHGGHDVHVVPPGGFDPFKIMGWVDDAWPHVRKIVNGINRNVGECAKKMSKTREKVSALRASVQTLRPQAYSLDALADRAAGIRKTYKAHAALERLRRAMEDVLALDAPEDPWSASLFDPRRAGEECEGMVCRIREDLTSILVVESGPHGCLRRIAIPRTLPYAAVGSLVRVALAADGEASMVRVTNANPYMDKLQGKIWLSEQDPREGKVFCSNGTEVDFSLGNDKFYTTECDFELDSGMNVVVEILPSPGGSDERYARRILEA